MSVYYVYIFVTRTRRVRRDLLLVSTIRHFPHTLATGHHINLLFTLQVCQTITEDDHTSLIH